MYDLAIIGGGPAGYVAAERAGEAGLSVILFEEKELGGVCLNEGCIPTKTLLYSAKIYDYARGGEHYGISAEAVSMDLRKVMKRKEKAVRKLVGGVKLKMKNAGAEVVKATAVIRGRNEDGSFCVEYTAGDGTSAAADAKNILVCTGSETAVPPIPGLRESSRVLTSREILQIEEIPPEIVILGGGVIGMEFASFFSSSGSKVTVIDMLPEILGPMDHELSALLRAQFQKKGVTFHLGSKVVGIKDDTVEFETTEGESGSVRGDVILLSTGRRARTSGIGLESIGIEPGRGIATDSHMRTSVPGIYAAGDITGFSMLAHTASREAEVAVADIIGKAEEMSYRAIPGVVYTNPEVAGTGLTEEAATEKGIPFTIKKLPMAYSGRFVAENERGEGLCKIIVGEGGSLLGVHLLGNYSSEIVTTAAMAIEKGMKVDDLLTIVFPHPSVSEIIKETLHL